MKSMFLFLPIKSAVLGMALALCFSATAQAQATSGNIAGNANAGDVVVATSPETGLTRKVTVGENGRYRIAKLPIGNYLITVQHANGEIYLTQPARVQVGTTTRIK